MRHCQRLFFLTGLMLCLISRADTWAQFAQQGNKLVGTGAEGTILRGSSVSLSADGNTAIVGGWGDNGGLGAAWVFTRTAGVWTQQGDKLAGAGAVGIAYQGISVSLSADGNTAIEGGFYDDGGAGAAWVFTRSGNIWSQQGDELVGTGAVGNAAQGTSVSLSADGNTAIVGGTDDNGGLGAAWVFTRTGGVWSQQGNKLVGTGAVGNACQGISVSLSADGNTAIVGGFCDNNQAGAVWVFTRTGGVWSQQGNKLVGTGAVGNAAQGNSVALSADGNTTIVGGWGDNGGAGAVWVFTRTGDVWSQQGNKLIGTGAVGSARQGALSLSADGNTAVVGGPYDDGGAGASWVFTQTGGVWTQQGDKLVGTGAVGSAEQGHSVSLSADGNTAIVGGTADNEYAGATWVFTRSGGVWGQQGDKLVGTGAVGSAYQGASVSLSADGNTAIVGGFYDNGSAGAAWVFTRTVGIWSQQGDKLVGIGAIGSPHQGTSVSLSGDGNTAAVGGNGDSSNVGAVWVFTRSGGVWSQQGDKLVGTGSVGKAGQGTSVSLSADGNTVIVGGTADDDGKGAVWVFTRSGGVWNQQGDKLVGTGSVGKAGQGTSVSLSADGNTAIVGGFNDNGGTGASWVFTQSGGVWSQQGSKLVGTGAAGSAYQGYSASLSYDGNTTIVGGLGDNDGSGAAWVFTRKGGVWSQQGDKLVGTGAMGSADQGASVALAGDGNTAIVGGFWEYNGVGAVWVFVQNATGVVEQAVEMSQQFCLVQNYPNPFNPSTTIKYELPECSVVRLSVYDALGREVTVLVNDRKEAGTHEVKFDGLSLASGVYFYRLQAGGFIRTKRLLVVR